MSSAIGYIKAGKLRALAVTGAMRVTVLPEIPTVSEFVPGYEASTWWGIGAPKNTTVEIINKLNHEINTGLADPKVEARIAEFGDAVFASSLDDTLKLIAEDTEKWGKVIRAASIKRRSVTAGSVTLR